MKQAFRLSWSGALALLLLAAAAPGARAQSASATPDSVVVQISVTTPTPPFTPTPAASPSPTPVPNLFRDTYAQDVSGDGRFVVMESTGDIATDRSAARNNLDGNVEIFLFDYAQRRIFQITNTSNALKNAALSPADQSNIDVAVRNLRPMISHDGRYIVFASNAYSDANPALSPKNFDGTANAAALKADGNMEIFLYEIPAVGAATLSSGAEVPQTDLLAGAMTRVTSTPASRVPTPGTAAVAPFIADDNRAATVNDDGSVVAFVSTRNIANVAGASNADANPEIFLWNRTSPSFIQATVTSGAFVFSDNPSLSGDGSVLAFFSTADIGSTEATADRGNGELYAANFNGTAVSNLRQLTRTPNGTGGDVVNVLSPGRRLSRNGQFLAFESTAVFNANGTLNGALSDNLGLYLVRVSDATFTLVGGRTPAGQIVDVLRFPAFTGDSANVVFASTLNLRATTGEALAEDSSEGLNGGAAGDANTATRRRTQAYSVAVPASGAPTNYQRLTRLPTRFARLQALPTDTLRRLAFSVDASELGGGNPDSSFEAYYLLVPGVTGEVSSPAVAFTTGASERPVVSASPAPTPPAVGGLAPGMLGIARSATPLAPSGAQVSQNDATESGANARRPPLPVELNGVTVSISGHAAGLFFVGPEQINFVVPPGLVITAAGTSTPVVINNNGTVIRTTLTLNPAQPDIFTSANGAGGRAAVLNVTNPCIAAPGEPFAVTTTRPTGGDCSAATTESVPTELLIVLTGVRNITSPASVTVTIGTTTIAGTTAADSPVRSVGPSRTSGFDQIVVRLPAGLAGAGDVPIVVQVTTTSAGAFTSRPADSAPRITIQ